MNQVSFSLLKKQALSRLDFYAANYMLDDILHSAELNCSSIAEARQRIEEWPVDNALSLIHLFPSILPVNWQSAPIFTIKTDHDWVLCISESSAA